MKEEIDKEYELETIKDLDIQIEKVLSEINNSEQNSMIYCVLKEKRRTLLQVVNMLETKLKNLKRYAGNKGIIKTSIKEIKG